MTAMPGRENQLTVATPLVYGDSIVFNIKGSRMPVYDYSAADEKHSCAYCANGFEAVQSIHDPHLAVCPKCGAPVRKCVVAPALGRSKSKLDDRAKAAGFTKLKKIGKGEYEKMY
jgi:putative FmdB family regulatory protein